jgi:hypothetical protein
MATTKDEYRVRSNELSTRLDATAEALEKFTRSSNLADLDGLGSLLTARTVDLDQNTSCFHCMRCVPLVVYGCSGNMQICRDCSDRSKTVRCEWVMCKKCDFCTINSPLDNLIDVKSKIWDC